MSNIAKEFESRIMLTNDEYLSIVSFYMKINPHQTFINNLNIYFDSDDLFLKNNHTTLRIRIINGLKYELTVKIKGENGDTEINDDISRANADLLINKSIFPEGEVKNYLSKLSLSLNCYHRIASLTNIRLEIQNNNHLLVIDKNTYGNNVDYDLEIEAENINTANTVLNDYIKKFNLSLENKKYVGKAHRAIDAAIND